MEFFGALHQTELDAKLVMQGFSVVAHNVETAASCGTIRSEGTDDDMAPRPDGMGDLSNIGVTQLDCRKKMKYRAVVPYVVNTGIEGRFRDIGDEPTDLFCGRSQSLLGHIDGSRRNIKNCDIPMAAREEVVGERRFTTANVNDGC